TEFLAVGEGADSMRRSADRGVRNQLSQQAQRVERQHMSVAIIMRERPVDASANFAMVDMMFI
ncbi:MAG: hypothetical protein WAX29_04255, partial [Propionibacterium sp.]